MNKNEFNPDYAVHPGEILQETLQARGINNSELAARSGLSLKHISQIIHGKAPVTPETAIMLERILDVKASIWLKIDSDYRLFRQKIEEQNALSKAFAWAKNFPIKEMVKRGFLPVTKDNPSLVAALLDFFNVGTTGAWEKQYADMAVQFRRNASKNDKGNEAIAAWLKIGENKAKQIAAVPYSKAKFEAALSAIKPLTREDPRVFEPEMVRLCAEGGVAVVFVPEFTGTGISGATYWLGSEKAILMLSLRYKWDDVFWFTFFHEAGHILLHSKDHLIVDGKDLAGDPRENEANKFAVDLLVPPKRYRDFVSLHAKPSELDILQFAESLKIAPGIVVGRLQKEGRIPYHWHTNLKRRFEIKV